MSRAEFARALNVNERTVERWESGAVPGGLAAEVIKGIQHALAEDDNHARIARRIAFGIGSLLYDGLIGKEENPE